MAATGSKPSESDCLVSESPKKAAVSEEEYHDESQNLSKEHKIRLKVDLRLCTIGGLLCSLNLLDSGIISSASVTSMQKDLGLDVGNHYSVSILIFTVASVCFQLPATLAVRILGPRIFFGIITFGFGLITLCTAFIHSWKQMIVMRVLLGIFMSGIYPGLALLISSWYRREELQLRFAYLQCGEVVVLATGGIVNFGLNNLDGRGGLKGWQWMFVVQGSYISEPFFPQCPNMSHKTCHGSQYLAYILYNVLRLKEHTRKNKLML